MAKNLSPNIVFYSCHRPQTAVSFDAIYRRKPVAVYNLGDDMYNEQTMGNTSTPYYGDITGTVTWPVPTTPASLQAGPAVAGALPTGALTVLNGGAGNAVSATLDFYIPNATGEPTGAYGTMVVNGSGVVTSATLTNGGAGFTNTGNLPFTPVSSSEPGHWLRKWIQQKASPEWREFIARRQSGQFKWYCIWDDHEVLSNWTFSVSPHDMGTRGGTFATASTAAQLLDFWRTAVAGNEMIRLRYYDNPKPSVGGDIPVTMQSVAGVKKEDFLNRSMFHWYGPNGEEGVPYIGIYVFDCISHKHPFQWTPESEKWMIGPTELANFEKAADAFYAAGGQTIIPFMSKDPGNIDNGDGWRGTGNSASGYYTELWSLMDLIQRKGYKVPFIGAGDRHQPHIAYFSPQLQNAQRGAAYNFTTATVCACPFGADPAGLTPYVENKLAQLEQDACVFGHVYWDAAQNLVTMAIVDEATGEETGAVTATIGSATAPLTFRSSLRSYSPSAPVTPGRSVITVAASPFVYRNQTGKLQAVAVAAGTVSAVSISRDGVTYDVTGLTNGQFVLGNGDFLKVTYTVAPTMAAYPLG